MNVSELIPMADAIPVPAGWFHVLLLATFVLHLLFMNTMLGGAVIALTQSLKPGGMLPGAHGPDHAIAKKLPYTVALTVNLGVPPLLFLQVLYGHFIYVSSLLMAVWWVSVFVLAMTAYYAAYIYDFKFAALSRARYLVIGLAVACLLTVGFIFTNNMTLMLRPEAWSAYFANTKGTIWNLGEPTLLPRYLHFVIASLAVGGLALALLGAWQEKKGQGEAGRLVNLGLAWFTWGTLAQLADGVWFLLAQPQEIMLAFLGLSGPHTAVLWSGVAAALAAVGLAMKRQVWLAAGAVVVAVTLMVVVRDLVRLARLAPHFHPEDLTVVPQYSPALVFLGSLVLGLAAIVWMLKQAAQAGKES
jgi:hypothetical protein